MALEMAAIFVAAFCVGTLSNAARPERHKLAWFRTQPPGPGSVKTAMPDLPVPATLSPAEPGNLYTSIAADVAHQLHRQGALFIDARRSDAFESGHIAGAWSIPVWEHDADQRVDAMVQRGVPFDREIVVYCSGPTCEDSARLAEKLALAGYYRIRLYEEGYPDWEMRGWPVTRGTTP